MTRARGKGARPPVATEEERLLFARTLKDAKPLARPATKTAPPPHPRPLPLPRGERESVAPRSTPLPPRAKAVPAAPAPKPNPGLDKRTAERFRKGEMAIDRRLDLHGMTQERAHAALDRFVRQAWADGLRVLLIITGKGSGGEGVLRRSLPQWLAAGEHAPRVLRLETAQPKHGGGGAFYVLLRRQREERS
jgi:DNA-nicking Smr family endonuclease